VREFVGACQGAGSLAGIMVASQGATSAAADFARRAGVEIWTVETLLALARQADGRIDGPIESEDKPEKRPATRILITALVLVGLLALMTMARACGDGWQ
jgi:hypothetical protein